MLLICNMEPQMLHLHDRVYIKQEPLIDVKEENLDCELKYKHSDPEDNAFRKEDDNPRSFTVMKNEYCNEIETEDFTMKFEEVLVDTSVKTIKVEEEILPNTSTDMTLDKISTHYNHHISEQLVSQADKETDRVQRNNRRKQHQRQYPCSICNKSFTQLGHLRTHMHKHTEEMVSKLKQQGKDEMKFLTDSGNSHVQEIGQIKAGSTSSNKIIYSEIKTKCTRTMRKIRNEMEQRRRDRIRKDPELYEEAKRKERERYHRRKALGKIKTISELPDTKKTAVREDWRERQKRIRERKKQEQELLAHTTDHTSPLSDQKQEKTAEIQNNIVAIGRSGTSEGLCGRKRIEQNLTRAYRRIRELEKKLEHEIKEHMKCKQSKEKYRKRLKLLMEKTQKTPNSRRKKVEHFLKGEKVSPEVGQFMLSGDTLEGQIIEKFEKNRTSRKALALVLSGKIIKKYQCIKRVPLKSSFGVVENTNNVTGVKGCNEIDNKLSQTQN